MSQQTTFTIAEIAKWLNSLDQFSEIRSSFEYLSSDNIIKANKSSIDWYEGDELDTRLSMDEDDEFDSNYNHYGDEGYLG